MFTNEYHSEIQPSLVTGMMDTKNDGEAGISEQHRGKLAGVSYGWVSTVTRKRPAQSGCFQTLIKYFKLYCKHSSLVGLKYLVEERVTWIERFLWIAVYVCTIQLVWSNTWVVYEEYVDAPITTTPEERRYPTQQLNFPAVAICTINRMSRRAAKELATEIFNANTSTLSVDEILKKILIIGDLYDSSFMPEDNYSDLIELLSNFYGNHYDTSHIMKRLTPQCSDTLLLCSLYGENRNCSDLFTMQKTQDGFCCAFNYVGYLDEISNLTVKHKKSLPLYKVGYVGSSFGLSVVMDPLLDDYFYPVLPITGWKVMIFNPYDYPDTASGSVIETLLETSVEKYMRLRAVGLQSTEVIREYPIEKRRCIFVDEKAPIYSEYSDSDCILTCKMEELWRACRCRPFFYPSQGNAKYINRTCGIQDIYCLWDYKAQIHHIVTTTEKSLMNVIKHLNHTLHCDCYPTCNDMTYIIDSTLSTLTPGFYKVDIFPAIKVTDHSILHIFFSEGDTTHLKQDESHRWYEYMSDACGIIALFIGFSLISVAELFYFTIFLLLDLLEPDPDPRTIRKDILHTQPPMRTIYWNELLPRSKRDAETVRRNRPLF